MHVPRYILVKYSHRGLADDVLWFNGDLKLFKQLFWTLYLTFLLLFQAAQVAKLYRGEIYTNPIVQRYTAQRPTLSKYILWFILAVSSRVMMSKPDRSMN